MPVPTLPEVNDAEAESKSGTTDPLTGIKHQVYQASDQTTPKAFTRLIAQMDNACKLLGASAAGLIVNLEDGLKVGALPIRYRIGATPYSFAGSASYTLTADATNYVYLDTDQILEHSISGWPEESHFKLAVVTTDATDVTAVSDRRYENFQVGVVADWFSIKPGTNCDLDGKGFLNLGLLDLEDWEELTMASGSIAPTQMLHTVDTEGDASSDTLTNITAVAGERRLLILRCENPTRVAKLVSSGNIDLAGDDYNLDDATRLIALVQDSDTTWTELSRNFQSLTTLLQALNCNAKKLYGIGQLGFSASEVTISEGEITMSAAAHSVDTENDAAADDLEAINGSFGDGEILVLCGEAPGSRVVTLKHDATGGNLWLQWGRDYVMDAVGKYIILMYKSALSRWEEVTRGYISIADLVGTAKALPYAPGSFFVAGALSVGDQTPKLYCPVEFTLKNATGAVGTAPSGGACIIDIKDDGSSIFANQDEMINIANGETHDTSATKNHVFAAGSFITIEVEAANSAADATVTLNGYAAPQTPPG